MDKDKIDKKDHILDVAERVFSDLGFDGASTRMMKIPACWLTWPRKNITAPAIYP